MTVVSRLCNESPLGQGVDEEICYQITTTPWCSSPVVIAVVVKDGGSSGTNVTATLMPVNAPSVVGDVITLSPLKAGTTGHAYRVEVKFSGNGNIYEAAFEVRFST